MADISAAVQRVLLVPDPRLTYADGYDATASTLTQAGPLPGAVTPAQDTELVLEASGEQEAATIVQVQAVRAGMPAPITGGAFAWRPSTTAEWRGWEPPQAIADWEALDYTTTADKWKFPQVIRLQDDSLACAVLKSEQYIRVFTKAFDAASWTENNVADLGTTYVFDGSACLLQLPGGRLLCFYWWEIAGNINQIYMSFSDDAGATWTLGQKGCLRDSLDTADYQPHRIRAGYLNGNIVLVAHVLDVTAVQNRDRIFQYASADLGASFALVSQTAGFSAGGDLVSRAYPEVVATDSAVYVAYLKETSSTPAIVPHVVALGNAFQALAGSMEWVAAPSLDWGAVAAGEFTAGELAFYRDEDGAYYMLGELLGAGSAYTLISTDAQNWEQFLLWWWRAGADGSGDDASTVIHPVQISAIAQGGRTVILSRWADFVSTRGRSLCATYLGGYTTVTLPNLVGKATDLRNRAAFGINYIPVDLPDDYEVTAPGAAVWTLASAGAPTISLADGGLKLALTAAADLVAYTHGTVSGSLQDGVIALVTGKATSTSATDGYAFAKVQTGDGVNSYQVMLRWNDDQVMVIDQAGPTTLGTFSGAAIKTAAENGIQFLVSVLNDNPVPANNGKVRVWWRARSSLPTDRDFAELALSSNTTLGDRGALDNEMQFGADCVTTNPTLTAYFYGVLFGYDIYTGQQLFDADGIHTLLGRTLPSSPMFVDGGLKLCAVDGPALNTDRFSIVSAYQYGIENVHPEVSATPRKGWRSTTNADPVELVWAFDSTLGENTLPLNGSVGLYLGNVNFRTASLWGYDGAWTKLADIDTATGQTALSFTRSGNVVRPSASVAGTPATAYFTHNILAGSYVQLSDGITTVIRKVLANGEGAWRKDDGTTKVPRLLLDGVLGGDPTGGIGNSAQVWSKDVLIVTNSPAVYAKYRLSIPAQDTYEGDFRIGVRVLGHVQFLTSQYSRGRILQFANNTELSTAIGGTRRSRVRGPQRRSVQLAWVDGTDTSDLTRVQPTPDTATAYVGSTDPIGVRGDAPYMLAGLSEALAGSDVPLVYCPTYVRQANGALDYTCNVRNNLVYGRLVSDVQLESQLGEEWGASAGEVFQVATVTIEEEV